MKQLLSMIGKKCFLVFLFLSGIVACSEQEDKLSAIPVIEGAYGVEKASREKDGFYNLHFYIARKYPDAYAIVFYENYFKDNSWEPVCQNSFQWKTAYVTNKDASIFYPVKSLFQIMINENEKEFVTIGVSHNGKELGNGKNLEKRMVLDDENILWDEDQQHIVISLNKPKGRYEDLIPFLKEFCTRGAELQTE